jgi:hypothetical protein
LTLEKVHTYRSVYAFALNKSVDDDGDDDVTLVVTLMVTLMVTGSNSSAHRGISSSRLCIGHRQGTIPLDVQLPLIFDFKLLTISLQFSRQLTKHNAHTIQ